MKRSKSKGSATVTIALLAVSGIAISVLGLRQIDRMTTTPGWVASADLAVGQVITKDSLKYDRGENSDTAIKDPRALIGRKLTIDKDEGEIFQPSDLTTPARHWLSQKIPEGRVLYTLIPQGTTIPHSQIRNGDRLDVIAKGARGVRTVAQNVLLIGTMQSNDAQKTTTGGLLKELSSASNAKKSKSRGGTPLILAVAPEDVYPLAGIGSGEEVTLVLHGEAEIRKGELLQVRPEAHSRRVEVYRGSEQENITVRR